MSRIDELKKQHPNLNVSLIDIVRTIDPTSTHKYLSFLVKMLNTQYDTSPEGLVRALFEEREINLVKKFEEHCNANRIKNNDISKFSTFEEMETEVNNANEIVKQKEAEKQVYKIYNDSRWTVLVPLTLDASQVYGSNTQWCITMEKYWNDYMWIYKVIFIIDKKKNEKFAVSVKYEKKILVQGWPADDKEIDPMLLPIPEDIFSIVLKEVRRPQYDTQFEITGDHSVMNSKGQVIKYEDASLTDVSFFYNKFSSMFDFEQKSRLRLVYEDKKKGFTGLVETLKDENNISGIEKNVEPTELRDEAAPQRVGNILSNIGGSISSETVNRVSERVNDDMDQLINRLRNNQTTRRLSESPTQQPEEDVRDYPTESHSSI